MKNKVTSPAMQDYKEMHYMLGLSTAHITHETREALFRPCLKNRES